MAWPARVKTTPHTCGGPSFGRRTPGCPRCDELAAGAAPVAWGNSKANKDADKARRAAVSSCRGHATCRVVCLCGDW